MVDNGYGIRTLRNHDLRWYYVEMQCHVCRYVVAAAIILLPVAILFGWALPFLYHSWVFKHILVAAAPVCLNVDKCNVVICIKKL